MENIIFLFFSISLGFSSTDFLLPYLNKIGHKFGIIDDPDSRKKHTKKISRSGGIAIYLGIMLSFILIFFGVLFNFLNIENTRIFYLFIIGTTSYFLIGLLDDLFDISPFLRLFLQFLTSAFIFEKGFAINSLNFNFFSDNIPFLSLPNALAIIFGSFWITGIVNSINWLDGLDGLASGFTSIVTTFFIIILLKNQNYELVFIPAAILGSTLGFLKNNYYPAKIFMGDSGSYLIGFSLSFISLFTFSEITDSDGLYLDKFNLPLGILMLFIPLFDMCLVVFNRLSKGKSPFFPDRSHLHHRLVDNGFSLENTVVLFYTLTLIFCLIVFYLI